MRTLVDMALGIIRIDHTICPLPNVKNLAAYRQSWQWRRKPTELATPLMPQLTSIFAAVLYSEPSSSVQKNVSSPLSVARVRNAI